jgi:hypothetical protein
VHFFAHTREKRERERVAIISKWGGVDKSVLWLSFAQQKLPKVNDCP